jgi:hypothetical protein
LASASESFVTGSYAASRWGDRLLHVFSSKKHSTPQKRPPRPPFGGRGVSGLRRAISRVPSAGTSEEEPTWRSFLWECRCRHPPARHPFQPADREHIDAAYRANRCMELLALARGGVCRAPSVTGTGGALLPHLFNLTCDRSHIGGLFSVALSLTRSPRAGGCYPPPLSYRARTFLAESSTRPPARRFNSSIHREPPPACPSKTPASISRR